MDIHDIAAQFEAFGTYDVSLTEGGYYVVDLVGEGKDATVWVTITNYDIGVEVSHHGVEITRTFDHEQWASAVLYALSLKEEHSDT